MISWWYRDDIVLYLIHKSDQICIWIYIWSSSVLRFFVFWHGSVWHASVCQKGAADEQLRGCLTLNPENPSPAPYRHGADPKDTAHRSLIARQRLHERTSCSCKKALLSAHGTLQDMYGKNWLKDYWSRPGAKKKKLVITQAYNLQNKWSGWFIFPEVLKGKYLKKFTAPHKV